MYESDHTKFMREWLAQHPEQAAEQQKGRALWWDKPQDFEAQRRFNEARVAQKPYPYQTDLTPTDAH
jgi:hypothetical protein